MNLGNHFLEESAWMAVLLGAAGYLFIIFVLSFLGLDERFLVVLALSLLAILAFWKASTNQYFYAILLVSSIYVGGVLSSSFESGIPITPFQVLLLLGLFLFGVNMLIRDDFDMRLTGFEMLLAAFIGLLFFSLIYSSNPVSGIFEIFRMSALFLFILLLINFLFTSHQITVLLIIITVFGTLLAAASAVTSLLNPEIAAMNYLLEGRGIASRGAVGDADPNFFATLFFIPVAFTTAILHSDARKSVWILAFLTLIVLIGGALSTYSRSAWVAIVFIGFFIMYHYRNAKILLALGGLFLLLLVAVPEIRLMLGSVFDRILDIFSGNVDASSKMRLVLGQVAIRMFIDNPLLGVGFRSFPIEFEKRNTAYGMLDVNEPHNITYMILAELGLVGLLLFGLLLFFLLRMAHQNLTYSRNNDWETVIATTLLASLIGYLVFHQFIPRFLTNNTLYVNIALIIIHHYHLTAPVRDEKAGIAQKSP
ncbi:MAG: hypothetical protein GVY08_03635 [Bacteroidetes bacterium]|nr:hypothetical protein [Bacteroidota bacterium]